MNKQDKLVKLGVEIAEVLPCSPRLHRLGYRRAVDEVDGVFVGASEVFRQHKHAEVSTLCLRAAPVISGEEWKGLLLRALGKRLEELRLREQLDWSNLQRVVGFARWAYVGNMPYWVFQCYPFSTRWHQIACQFIWYKLLPLEKRGEYFPPVPEGWEEDQMFLHDGDWVFVIRYPDPDLRSSVPSEWELVDFTEGKVVVWISSLDKPVDLEYQREPCEPWLEEEEVSFG